MAPTTPTTPSPSSPVKKEFDSPQSRKAIEGTLRHMKGSPDQSPKRLDDVFYSHVVSAHYEFLEEADLGMRRDVELNRQSVQLRWLQAYYTRAMKIFNYFTNVTFGNMWVQFEIERQKVVLYDRKRDYMDQCLYPEHYYRAIEDPYQKHCRYTSYLRSEAWWNAIQGGDFPNFCDKFFHLESLCHAPFNLGGGSTCNVVTFRKPIFDNHLLARYQGDAQDTIDACLGVVGQRGFGVNNQRYSFPNGVGFSNHWSVWEVCNALRIGGQYCYRHRGAPRFREKLRFEFQEDDNPHRALEDLFDEIQDEINQSASTYGGALHYVSNRWTLLDDSTVINGDRNNRFFCRATLLCILEIVRYHRIRMTWKEQREERERRADRYNNNY